MKGASSIILKASAIEPASDILMGMCSVNFSREGTPSDMGNQAYINGLTLVENTMIVVFPWPETWNRPRYIFTRREPPHRPRKTRGALAYISYNENEFPQASIIF